MAFEERAREGGMPLPHTDLVAPDAEIDMSRRVFNPEVYRGFEGWARLNDELREVWDEWRITPERYVEVGDRVVVIACAHARGRGSGVELEIRYSLIWTLREGRVTRAEMYSDPDEALRVVGLEE